MKIEMALAILTILLSLAPAMSPALARVPTKVLMGAATNTARPDYPVLARRQSNQNPVEVDVIVAPDGTVKEAEVLSGNILLWDGARAAALKWRFDTGKLHVDQDVIGTLVFSFNGPEEPAPISWLARLQ